MLAGYSPVAGANVVVCFWFQFLRCNTILLSHFPQIITCTFQHLQTHTHTHFFFFCSFFFSFFLYFCIFSFFHNKHTHTHTHTYTHTHTHTHTHIYTHTAQRHFGRERMGIASRPGSTARAEEMEG